MQHLRQSTVLFYFVSLILFFVVAYLRLVGLGTIPQGLTKDEAYYGYDAYSVMHTGRDIWGESYPLRFKSTGEYKLNLTYFIIPAIKLFGLTETAVRTPSAIFGLLTLPVLFATFNLLSVSRWLSLFLTLVFALSPWSFGMSRLFYESNVGLFFVALGIYGILRHHFYPSKFILFLAPFSLALSAYLYGPYLYIGLTLILIHVVALRRLARHWLLYFLAILPFLLSLAHGGGLTRLSQEWALKQPGYAMEVDEARMNCYLSFGRSQELANFCYPFWNKPLIQFQDTLLVFLRSLSPEYLFFSGVNDYILPNKVGAYPLSLIPFYLLAILALPSLLKSTDQRRRLSILFLLVALMTAVAIVSLAGRVELYRNPVGLYLVFIFLGLGLSWFIHQLRSIPGWILTSLLVLIFALPLLEQTRYLIQYFTHYTRTNPLVFSADSREIYTYLGEHRDFNYLVDTKFHGPIYAAFYWQIDPTYFRENVVWGDPDPWGWINAKSIGNVYSTEFTLEQLLCLKAKNPDDQIAALIVSDPTPPYQKYASFSTQDTNQTLRLHDVYDIDYLYTQKELLDNCR